jgi:hypothetical protein
MSTWFICQSSSPFTTLVLFVQKLDGGLGFWNDYQDINSKTINNRYPILLMKECWYLLGKAHIPSWISEGLIIYCKLRRQRNISSLLGPDMNCLYPHWCNLEWQMHKRIFRGTLIIQSGRRWVIVHQHIWMMFWYITILRRNMLAMSSGLCNGCWKPDCIWIHRSASSIRKTWGIWDWLYQQRTYLWIKIRLRQYEIGVVKRRHRVDTWIIVSKYNSMLNSAMILNGSLLSIPKQLNIWPG